VVDIRKAEQESGIAAKQVMQSADALAADADLLKHELEAFLAEIRAA